MNQSLSEIIRGNQKINNKFNQKKNPQKQWKNDKFESTDDQKYFVKVSNLHWNVSEVDLKTLFGGDEVVENVRIKYDSSGRSLGQAELLFKSVELAKNYQSKFNGETLDGMALSIELLRPFLKKKPKVQEKGGVFDRLGSSKVGKKQGGKSLDARLGKRIEDRLGKSLDERLGNLPQGNPSKPKKNKKKKAGERKVTDYGDTQVAENDGEMILG